MDLQKLSVAGRNVEIVASVKTSAHEESLHNALNGLKGIRTLKYTVIVNDDERLTIEKLSGKKLLFASNDYQVPADEDTFLVGLAAFLKKHPGCHLAICGYADSTGDSLYNFQLSQKRALAVKKALCQKGCDSLYITARGCGEQQIFLDQHASQSRYVHFIFEEEP